MYFTIQEDKLEELKLGKTNTYISKITGYSRQYLTYIFRKQIKINSSTAVNIIMPLSRESTKLGQMLKEKGLNYMIDYFFEEEM